MALFKNALPSGKRYPGKKFWGNWNWRRDARPELRKYIQVEQTRTGPSRSTRVRVARDTRPKGPRVERYSPQFVEFIDGWANSI